MSEIDIHITYISGDSLECIAVLPPSVMALYLCKYDFIYICVYMYFFFLDISGKFVCFLNAYILAAYSMSINISVTSASALKRVETPDVHSTSIPLREKKKLKCIHNGHQMCNQPASL